VKKVLLLLANGFEAYEAAAFTDVLGWVNDFGDTLIAVATAGMHPTLTCTFALTAIPAVQLEAVDVGDFDALAIPGGFEGAGFYEDAYAEPFLEVIRAFDALHKPVAAICVAALPVARSGVLQGRQATTYALMGGKRRAQLAAMGAVVVDAPLVRDGNVITSTGPSTAIDVAFALLELLTSPENAAKVRHLMGFD
jgi:4-methyl-5(b-hydroxyethyl)-thiazole monophosphate biosynthesis